MNLGWAHVAYEVSAKLEDEACPPGPGLSIWQRHRNRAPRRTRRLRRIGVVHQWDRPIGDVSVQQVRPAHPWMSDGHPPSAATLDGLSRGARSSRLRGHRSGMTAAHSQRATGNADIYNQVLLIEPGRGGWGAFNTFRVAEGSGARVGGRAMSRRTSIGRKRKSRVVWSSSLKRIAYDLERYAGGHWPKACYIIEGDISRATTVRPRDASFGQCKGICYNFSITSCLHTW